MMGISKPGQFLSGKQIIVAGAGISGSTFIAGLDKQWDPSLPRPEITVYERENRESSIEQNAYMLDLKGGNQDEGLIAIQQLGLLDEVRSHSTLNSGDIWVWSDTFKMLSFMKHKAMTGLPAATMRISRQHLKRILLQRAEKSNAIWRWRCTCTTAERLPDGRIRVIIFDFEAGTTFTQDCDLLIAADGAESKMGTSLRPHDMKFTYAGANQIGGISHFPDGVPKPVDEDYGLQMSSGQGICCIYTPFDEHTIGWALSRMGPERRSKTGPFTAGEFATLKTEGLKTGSMFKEPFRTIVEATDPATAFIRPAKERGPFAHDASQGVVFIGDANHVLNVFTLDGANLALKDGWDLAEVVCRSYEIGEAIMVFDKRSVPRAEHVVTWSHERIRFGHSRGLMWKVYKYGMKAKKQW